MVLRMACPTKRGGSYIWFFRKRIPADVCAILTKSPDLRPARWFKDHISISLGTPDRDTAKAKCPEVALEVERQIAALRAGPKPLSQRQIAALSGELYKAFAVGLEANPVLTPQQWLRVAAMNEEGRQGQCTITLLNENGNVADASAMFSSSKSLGGSTTRIRHRIKS